MPTWFRKGVSPGTTITLDQSVASRWEVVERLSEDDEQLFEADRRRGEKTFLCRHQTALSRP